MDKQTTKIVHMITFSLMVIGGLNWGLVGLLNVNVVELIFGSASVITRIVYILVGLSTAYIGATHMQDCKICSEKAVKSEKKE